MMLPTRAALALTLALSAAPLAPASADTILPDPNDYCTTDWVIKAMKNQVDSKYRQYIGEDLFLIDVINPQMTRETERDAEHNVGRKFCHAKALMSDGRKRDLWYLLEKPWGFAGTPFLSGLEFCISGLDPWHVYGKNCSTVR